MTALLMLTIKNEPLINQLSITPPI